MHEDAGGLPDRYFSFFHDVIGGWGSFLKGVGVVVFIVIIGSLAWAATEQEPVEQSTDHFIRFDSVEEANAWLERSERVQILKWDADVAYAMIPASMTTSLERREVYVITVLYRQHPPR